MIDCPEILQGINFKINSKNCREKNLFCIKNVTTSYTYYVKLASTYSNVGW